MFDCKKVLKKKKKIGNVTFGQKKLRRVIKKKDNKEQKFKKKCERKKLKLINY